VVVHVIEEAAPLGAWAAIFQEEMRAVLVGRVSASAWPMVVRDNVFERDSIPLHHESGELGGAVESCAAAVSAMFAHFDAD
jgi:hypothetical protein